MSNLFDELLAGTVSRRQLFAALPLVGGSAAIAAAQTAGQAKPQDQAAGELKLSPANIGGGGRVERNFYREWIKKSKVPMAEGYSILDAKNQPVEAWPEVGGRGLYLNF